MAPARMAQRRLKKLQGRKRKERFIAKSIFKSQSDNYRMLLKWNQKYQSLQSIKLTKEPSKLNSKIISTNLQSSICSLKTTILRTKKHQCNMKEHNQYSTIAQATYLQTLLKVTIQQDWKTFILTTTTNLLTSRCKASELGQHSPKFHNQTVRLFITNRSRNQILMNKTKNKDKIKQHSIV